MGFVLAGGGVGEYSADDTALYAQADLDVSGQMRYGESGFASINGRISIRDFGGTDSQESEYFSIIRLGRMLSGNAFSLAFSLAGTSGESTLGDSHLFTLSAPITVNGFIASVELEPSISVNPASNGYVDGMLTAKASIPAMDTIVKPGLSVGYTAFTEGYKTVTISPEAGMSWYPGFPMSAGSAYSLSAMTDGLQVEYSQSLTVFLAVSPVSRILVSLASSSSFSSGAFSSDSRARMLFTLVDHGKVGVHFPVTITLRTGNSSDWDVQAGIRLELP